MKNITRYILLGLVHGLNDFVAGFLVGGLVINSSGKIEGILLTLTYNLLAFGGQLAVAEIAERKHDSKKYLLLSLLLLIVAMLSYKYFVAGAILCAGISSALVHVIGDTQASAESDKAAGIGFFAAPGIAGLMAGAYLAYLNCNILLPIVLVLLVFMLAVYFLFKHQEINQYNKQKLNEESEKSHDALMILLLLVISLRSVVWDVIRITEEGNFSWLAVITVAAMTGKFIGGMLSDRIGHKNYSLFALLLSLPLLSFFRRNLIALSAGVFLLQSTIAPATVMMIQVIKRKKALAVSFSFGLSVFIGMLLLYSPAGNFINSVPGIFICIGISVIVMSAFSLSFFGRKSRKGKTE